MPTINVVGVLKNPFNVPIANATIRFTATRSDVNSVQSSFAEFNTNELGEYQGTVFFGEYWIELRVTDTFERIGYALIESSTPSPSTLNQVLQYTSPVVPPTVIDAPADWVQLIDNVREGTDTLQQERREQTIGDESKEIEVVQVLSNEVIGADLAEEVTQSSSRESEVNSQMLAYSDSNVRQAALSTEEVKTQGVTIKTSQEAYRESDGARSIKYSDSADAGTIKRIVEHTLTADQSTYAARAWLRTEAEHLNTSEEKILRDSSEVTEVVQTSTIEGNKENIQVSSITTEVVGTSYTGEGGVVQDTPKISLDVSKVLSEQGVDKELTKREEVSRAEGVVISSEVSQGDRNGREVLSLPPVGGSRKIFEVDSFDIKRRDDSELPPVFSVDAQLGRVTLNGQLSVTNPDDFKGGDGDTIFDVYEYSVGGQEGTWHSEFETGDIYRRTNRSVNGIVDPLTWSAGAKIAGEDGQDGDTIYFEYQYSANQTDWYAVLADGHVWRRERIVTNGVGGEWTTAARLVGTDGVDGNVVFLEYEYSVDGIALWHSNFATGDHYRRERAVTYPEGNAGNAIYGVWSNPSKLVPEKGVDYLDGRNQATVFLHIRQVGEPTPPSGVITYDFDTGSLSGNLEGWTRSIPLGAGDVWVATATANSFESSDVIHSAEWTVSLLATDGNDGVDGRILRAVYRIAENEPSRPTGTNIPPNQWTEDTPITLPEGQSAWVSYSYAADSNTDIGTGFWTPVGKWRAPDGVDGKIVRIVYRNSVNKPSKPTGNDIPPTGWTETPSVLGAGEVTWTSGTYSVDEATNQGNGFWLNVSQWSGYNGLVSRVFYKKAETKPVSPSGTTLPPNGWLASPPVLAQGEKSWAVLTYAVSASAGVGTGEWTDTGIYSAVSVDGITRIARAVYRISSSKPSKPTGVSIPPSGWSTSPPTLTPGQTSWVSVTYAESTTSGSGDGTWTEAGIFARSSIDGLDGKVIQQVFRLGVNKPATPTGVSVPPTGWTDNPPDSIPDGQYVWASHTYIDAVGDNTGTGSWTVPAQWSGNNGQDGRVVRGVYRRAATKPSVPTGTAIPPTGWSESVPTAEEGELIWAVYTYSDTPESNVGVGSWTAVGQWQGVAGQNGLQTAIVSLYQLGNTNPPKPSNTLNYSFVSGALQGTPNNGWSTEYPDNNASGGTVWTTSATAIARAEVDTDNILGSEWSTPVRQVVNGGDGLNQATVYVYKRAENQPNAINNTTTYSFVTGILGGSLDGWSQSIPSGEDTIWVASASAISSGNTDSIAASEWSVGLLASSGEDGIQVARVSLFRKTEPEVVLSDIAVKIEVPDQGEESITFESSIAGLVEIRLLLRDASADISYSLNGKPWNIQTVGDADSNTWFSFKAEIQVGTNEIFVEHDGSIPLFIDTLRVLTTSTILLPSNSNTYSFTQGKLITSPNNGWSVDFPSIVNKGDVIWTTIATALKGASFTTDTINASDWTDPVQYVINGVDGDNGTDGQHGAGHYSIVARGGVFPSDAVATTDFINHVGRSPVLDDHLTYLNSSTSPTTVSVKRYNGTSWVAPAQIIDGDLLVKGTVTGDRLVADSITSEHISADAANFVLTHIEDGSITNAKIGDQILSENYIPNTRGWYLGKDGTAEFQNLRARGYLFGSVIEGSTIILGEDSTTVPTQADTGVNPRYLTLANPITHRDALVGQGAWNYVGRSFGSMCFERPLSGNSTLPAYNFTGEGTNNGIFYNNLNRARYSKVRLEFNHPMDGLSRSPMATASIVGSFNTTPLRVSIGGSITQGGNTIWTGNHLPQGFYNTSPTEGNWYTSEIRLAVGTFWYHHNYDPWTNVEYFAFDFDLGNIPHTGNSPLSLNLTVRLYMDSQVTSVTSYGVLNTTYCDVNSFNNG